jgi:hypothetical protein
MAQGSAQPSNIMSLVFSAKDIHRDKEGGEPSYAAELLIARILR